MNKLQLLQRLHSETGRSTEPPTVVTGLDIRNNRLMNRLDDAWQELQSARDWRWMRKTLDVALTIGQRTYTGAGLSAARFGRWRPEDCDYTPGVYVDGSINTMWDLSFLQLDEFKRMWVYRNDYSSQPLYWAVDENDRLLIGPKPSITYKLRIDYLMEPSTLVLADDTPDLPNKFHLLLVWKALQDEAKFDASPEILALAESNYSRMYDALLHDQGRLPTL